MTPGALPGLLEAIPLPALLVRRDERIEAANSEARALLGTGIDGRHFITALRQPTLLDAVEATLRDGSARVTQFLTNDGRQDTSFRVSLRPVTLEQGQCVLVVFEDITHLEQAVQMRRDFVANVSHELRTPLTALLGFIETLRGPARNDPAAQERFLAIMEKEAGRMNRLVADLLSLSRVESDERRRPTTLVDPVALMRSICHGLAPLAEQANVTLELTVPEDAIELPGDEDQLRQVFTNLIENALKYGGSGGRVELTIAPPQEEPRLRARGCRITVRDFGPGVDPVHLPRLTERFYRVDAHRSREKGGTGLGLAIVKHIINRHRGRLRIDSKRGEGVTATVLLPMN
ncbi:ATP-binding protein [Mesobacterium sp. TK19101]|uniref:histidine kinase n=1 Tax=Mesobacterium hydrothermale TaxID=3111907 RepID=A0ABU6HKI7_9RHOB|nr:ATP-binding protein [Mesobacterium sp. TK19101]MEC3862401.1 ATP-binding protein [Mesobacterium sp. TK19101]